MEGGSLPLGIHILGQHPKQFQQQWKAVPQFPVPFDQFLHNGIHRRVRAAAVLELANPAAAGRQIVLHIDIAAQLPQGYLDHIHGATPGLDIGGMDRIGRDHHELLLLQLEPGCIDQNFTT